MRNFDRSEHWSFSVRETFQASWGNIFIFFLKSNINLNIKLNSGKDVMILRPKFSLQFALRLRTKTEFMSVQHFKLFGPLNNIIILARTLTSF